MNYSHVESTLDDTDEFTEQVEWMGVTTNSDDCSYSSDMDDVRSSSRLRSNCDYNYTPSAILNPPSAKGRFQNCYFPLSVRNEFIKI